MQPYFFPYLGYWQLLNYVDRFVVYDDVNYIKGGWVNRNRILINGDPRYLTVPIIGASQNKMICDLEMDTSAPWRRKMLKSIEGAYCKSPSFDEVYPVLHEVISYDCGHLATFLENQLDAIAKLLGITTELRVASGCYEKAGLAGEERIVDICLAEGATTYINPEGGMHLYHYKSFYGAGVSLQFLKMNSISYEQNSKEFQPNLSIIDLLMSLGSVGVQQLLEDFTLIVSAD